MSSLTVIIPCAGEAKRLGISFPKELFPVKNDFALIDYCFSYFSECRRDQVNFVLTITERKLDIIKYLKKYSNRFNISFTYFNNSFNELPGSIKSAYHLFGENNLLLLPDTRINYSNSRCLYTDVMNILAVNPGVILYKETSNHDFLKSKGCLKVLDSNKLILFEDKPIDTFNYNSAWCSIGFKKNNFFDFINVLESSILKDTDATAIFNNSLFKDYWCLKVEDFVDLGTWPDIISEYKKAF